MRSSWIRAVVVAAGAGGLVGVTACSHIRNTVPGLHSSEEAACPPGQACADDAKVGKNPTVRALASDLDHLEKHIECYGSVTAKVPDVWGQARLTQYREDFEAQMKAELTTFNVELQGNSARSDQSYLAAALSLGLAAQPSAPVIGSVTTGNKSVSVPDPKPIVKEVVTSTSVVDKDGKKTDTKETSGLPDAPAPAKAPDPLKAESPGDPATLVSGVEKVVNRTPVTVTQAKYAYADKGIGIEPAERLAQKKRYLDLLAQLRRENEGSDTADAPGYQLNLVRLPVSVLPGSHTDRGHGAEVTFTIDPVLGDDLLPTTFRRMATNDLVEQLSLPLAEAFYDKPTVDQLNATGQKFVRLSTRLYEMLTVPESLPEGSDPPRLGEARALVQSVSAEDWMAITTSDFTTPAFNELLNVLKDPTRQSLPKQQVQQPQTPIPTPTKQQYLRNPAALSNSAFFSRSAALPPSPPAARGGPRRAATAGNFALALGVSSLSFATGLDNRLAFPTSQLLDVYGEAFVYEIAYAAKQAIVPDVNYRGFVHLPDVQSFLKQETQAAYQFLAKNPELLREFCRPELVQSVRSRRVPEVVARRAAYRATVAGITGSTVPPGKLHDIEAYKSLDPRQFNLTAALAWCLIVDSAMLTDRLIRDVRETATAKGLPAVCPPDAWPEFYLPEPDAAARQQFNAYVKMRWPVYVFALDPMAQEQNVADSLSTRRETQLALAVGFTNGAVSAKTFLNASRRLEAEAQTIALNRTQVGFAHGENTFGWRFYPRFQTMPTQTNFTVLFRDQLIGGPTTNAVLRQRRLEPGPRECVALVIMPSFVPYVNIDSVSNWFRLPDPKCKVLDHTQAVALSKTVRTLERCEHTVTDAECYRDGELKRLQTRVHQLAGRLPAQSVTVPVPILDTVGGFELFSNGTSDMAPQLFGFYGAPGIDPAKATTLFLVGDHFSPLHSKVIVGNQAIGLDGLQMLSRQVMQVTVPAGVLGVAEERDGKKLTWAHAHVATPYGVSREVYIPVLLPKADDKPAKAPAEGFSVKPDAVTVTYRLVPNGDGTHRYDAIVGVDPAKFQIAWADATGSMPSAIDVRFVFEYAGHELPIPATHFLRLPDAGDKFEMTTAEAAGLADALIRAVGPGNIKPGANPLDAPFVTKKIEVTPVKDGTRVVQTKTTDNQLTLKLVGQYAPPAAVNKPAPMP